MNLTREQAIYEHRKMWNWIADECLKRKRKVEKYEYFDEHPVYGEIPQCYCWCCEYSDVYCSTCPIQFDGPMARCTNKPESPTIYNYYFSCCDYNIASECARKIANFPERSL